MATLHFRETTTSSPEQFIAALTDSGPAGRRSSATAPTNTSRCIRSAGHADVTEGSGGVWERWTTTGPAPTASSCGPRTPTRGEGRGHTYVFTPQPDGTTVLDATVVREGKNLKGRSLGLVLGTVGRGVLRKTLKNTIKAIEVRNNEAKAPEPA